MGFAKQIIDQKDMAAGFYSEPLQLDVQQVVHIQLAWTGSPRGEFEVWTSGKDSPVLGTDDDWVHRSVVTFPDQPSGAAGSTAEDFVEIGAGWLRLKYNPDDTTPGAGTADGWARVKD